MRRGAKRSMVWKFFNRTDRANVTCILCKKQLKYFTSTTNLKQHLVRRHPVEHSAETEIKLENIRIAFPEETAPGPSQDKQDITTTTVLNIGVEQETLDLAQRTSPEHSRQVILYGVNRDDLSESEKEDIHKCLIKMLVCDYQPLSLVENKDFLEYTMKLNPFYELPCVKTLTNNLLPRYYGDALVQLKSKLDTVDYLSASTDIWTSDSNVSYITVTAHFIRDKTLNNQVLATRELTDTPENIAEVITAIFDEWEIGDKIVAVVTDDSADIKSAVNHLLKCHQPCVAHTLNLNIHEALNSPNNSKLLSVIKKCEMLLGPVKRSVASTEKLKKYQEEMYFPILNVKQDAVPRWNACLVMMERLLVIKQSSPATVNNLATATEVLDSSDWDILADCVSILKPFEMLTVELSGEKYTSISLIIPLMRGLQYAVKNVSPITDAGLTLQKTILDVICRRLSSLETNKIACIATFLDPRLKKTAFGLETNADNAERYITEELGEIISHSSSRITMKPAGELLININGNQVSLWSHFENKLAQVKTFTASMAITLMVRQYLEMPFLDRNENPLEFWENHQHSLPELYKMHLKYLNIPATSIPAESVFSQAGQHANSRRNRLSPENLGQIIFLNSYLS